MKWKSYKSIAEYRRHEGSSKTSQIQRINTASQNLSQSHNLNVNLTSIPKPNWLISTVFVAIAFTLIPIFPILIAFLIGHWISHNNKKK